MRRTLRYRKLGNASYENHVIEDFAGESIGIRDIHDKMIYEGDFISSYDMMLKDYIKGIVTYIPPSFCIKTCDGYHQSLDNLNNIELIKP